MASTQFDNPWPWLRIEPEEDPPGFRVGGDAAGPIPANISFGLSNWQPPKSLQRPPWLAIEPKDDPPAFSAGTGIADPIPASTSVGLSNWRPPNSVQQPADGSAADSLGLSNWQPPRSFEQPSWIGFRMKPDGSIDEARTSNTTHSTPGCLRSARPPPWLLGSGRSLSLGGWRLPSRRKGTPSLLDRIGPGFGPSQDMNGQRLTRRQARQREKRQLQSSIPCRSPRHRLWPRRQLWRMPLRIRSCR